MVSVWRYMYTNMFRDMCMHTCMHACMHVSMYLSMHMLIYSFTACCIYTYIGKDTDLDVITLL